MVRRPPRSSGLPEGHCRGDRPGGHLYQTVLGASRLDHPTLYWKMGPEPATLSGPERASCYRDLAPGQVRSLERSEPVPAHGQLWVLDPPDDKSLRAGGGAQNHCVQWATRQPRATPFAAPSTADGGDSGVRREGQPWGAAARRGLRQRMVADTGMGASIITRQY